MDAADGRIVYSDEPRLIGEGFRLAQDEREALASNGVDGRAERPRRGPRTASSATTASCSRSTCRSRRPNGTTLLFETYSRYDSVAATAAA